MATSKKHERRAPRIRVDHAKQEEKSRAAIGLEAEFSLVVDGQPATPEELFGSPTAFVREKMMHRTGRSYHLPTGGAVYFDTGVIEVATPMIELAPGCAARAGRSLWESIHYVRTELDAWERRNNREVHLVGFSAHYNVSFDLPESERNQHRTVQKLAVLLSYIMPFPVMLLAANRESTGIGMRPRSNRIEITADFTPDAALSIATATFIVAVIRQVMTWHSYELDQLNHVDFPIIRDFAPIPHSSRKGWVAKFSCYSRNPFQCDVDAPTWATRDGKRRSLREIAALTTRHFSRSIRYYADPPTRMLINAVMRGRTRSLLELPQRPHCYSDVGNACCWGNLYSERTLARSRYERVLLRAVARQPMRINGEQYTPTAVHGWSHVVFRRNRDGQREELSVDEVSKHIN